jgi:hypothetical protein
MPNFELRLIESIRGKQSFYHLIVDGINQADTFYSDTVVNNQQYKSEIKSIYTLMERVAKIQSVAKKYKEITPPKVNILEHEFKTKHLRAYVFQLPGTGKVVTYWGTKGTQPDDISEFRRLKKLYLKSIGYDI